MMPKRKWSDRRRWSPVSDPRDVVHHGIRLTKKEALYLFRLADAVRAIISCGECGASEGVWCLRKRDGQPRANHSCRVQQARRLFEQHVLPRLDRLHYTLCSSVEDFNTYGPAVDRAVDCMSCLVAAAR